MLQAVRSQKNLAIVVILLAISTVQAQQKEPASRAPLPAQVASARTVFIAYAGGDSNFAGYSGETDRTYNEFYAALKSWGRYEIAAAPASADLVFEIGFIHPLSSVSVSGGGKVEVTGGSSDDPQFKLSIRDAKSNVLLWTVTRHIQRAILAGNRDKNFEQAMGYLLDDMKRMVEPPVPAGKSDSK